MKRKTTLAGKFLCEVPAYLSDFNFLDKSQTSTTKQDTHIESMLSQTWVYPTCAAICEYAQLMKALA